MQLWKKLLSALFPLLAGVLAAGCAGAPAPPFAVRSASVEHGVLSARLDWQPSPLLLDALDHGIALDFDISLKAQTPNLLGINRTLTRTHWHRELRYFPLTRQYQLRDPNSASGSGGETRSYAARASLIAAIADLRLALPADFAPKEAQTYVLSVDLQRNNLPGALRLPALIDADWRLSTGNFAWPAKPNAG